MKQTAVEWLIKIYLQTKKIDNFDIEQAKAMEKEQIKERMYSEAIEFAEWIRIKDFQTTEKDNWIGLELRYYTTEELFEQFKKK